MASQLSLVFSCLLTFSVGVLCSTPCDQQSFNYSSVVCRCNATYCDTVPELQVVANSYTIYTSSMSGDRFKNKIVSFSPKRSPSNGQIMVDKAVDYQTIIGFGGAITDAASISILSLTNKTSQKLVESYFSPNGIEYTLGRIPVASCDFSTHVYSYDDVKGDFGMKHFALVTEDLDYKIPIVKSAQKMSQRQIKLFSTPWSAPSWQKRSDSMVGGGFIKGQVGGRYYQAYADYYVKFLDAYKEQGIDFWGLTPQNEPLFGLFRHFPFQGTGFTPVLQRDYIKKNLGPALKAAGYGGLKLMTMDDNTELLPYWANAVYSDPEASGFVSGLAIHWYMNDKFQYDRLTRTHNVNPNKFMLSTEACQIPGEGESAVELGNWERAEGYTHDILQDLQHWVTGWTDWNIALNMAGGPNWVNNTVDSPIIVNGEADEFYKQPMYYALGHFSKFVTPDSIRHDMTIKGSDVDGVVFTTPEKHTVMVLYNNQDSTEEVDVTDGDTTFSVTLSARSFNTIIY